MSLKLITAITTEPITLAELKTHLKIESSSFADDITTTQSIPPAEHDFDGVGADINGVSVDVLGKKALVNLVVGTCNGSGVIYAKIQESDNNIAFTNWTNGTFTPVGNSTIHTDYGSVIDNATYEKEYTGTKRYIRIYTHVEDVESNGAATCNFGVDIITKLATAAEDEDLLIMSMIKTAREFAEDYSKQSLATQTWEYMIDHFPCGNYIEIPRYPLISVTSIKYKDSSGAETTMTVNDEYIVDSDSRPGRVVLPYGKSWPSVTLYTVNPIRIRFVCGYTETEPNIIPLTYKQGMMMHAGMLHKYRDAGVPKEDIEWLKSFYSPRRFVNM